MAARKAKKQRIPPRSSRAAGAPKYPTAAERVFEARLRAMARGFASYVRRSILPRVADFAKKDAEHTDAKDVERNPAAKAEGKKMQAAADQAFSSKALASLSDKAANQIANHSKDEFKRLRIDTKKEPELKHLISGWSRDIAGGVKGMTEKQVSILEEILATGNGRHADTIAREIEERLGIIGNRAGFIARSSVAKLNSRITRRRYFANAIEQYVWLSQDDERVRPAHEELDGETFDVDGPGDPDEGHPGDAPLCRCVAWPIRPDEAPDPDELPSDDEFDDSAEQDDGEE